jgi:hypothetical protein
MTQPLTGIRAECKMSYRSIEERAKQLRTKLGLGQLDRFDATGFYNDVLPDSTIVCNVRVRLTPPFFFPKNVVNCFHE